MKRISSLGPSLLLAVLAGISYFLITDIDTKDFTSIAYSSANMPLKMTQSFNKRTRFSYERNDLNRAPFIHVKVLQDKRSQDNKLQFSIALSGDPVKEKYIPRSNIMNLSPYVTPGNDYKTNYENYSNSLTTPPVLNSGVSTLPQTQYSYSYGYSLENKLDEINSKYDEMLDQLSSNYEACLDQVQNDHEMYNKLKTQYRTNLNNLKVQHKKELENVKKISHLQDKRQINSKDIKGCTFTVEVVKTYTQVPSARTNTKVSTPNPNITRSKAVIVNSEDESDSDDMEE